MGGEITKDEDYLLISGIQHFVFCRRQWALIHIEMQWNDNVYTATGDLMHKNAHNPDKTEKRKDIIITRDMPIFSRKLGIRGACDVVEFHRDTSGVLLFGREGLWLPCPVEYKSGESKTHDADRLQLCAQAICLEEMLLCNKIEEAYLYYGATKRREPVSLTNDLRKTVSDMFIEMRDYYRRGYTPRVKLTKSCGSCSLKDSCLPKMPAGNKVAMYIDNALSEE